MRRPVRTICSECGIAIRPGRLDVHARCRPPARARGYWPPGSGEGEGEGEGDHAAAMPTEAVRPTHRLPIHLPLVAGPPCTCPACRPGSGPLKEAL